MKDAEVGITVTQPGQHGWGFDAPNRPGEYELNIYFNDELIQTTPFKVTD